MRKGLFVLAFVLIIAILNGCGEKQVSDQNKQVHEQPSIHEQQLSDDGNNGTNINETTDNETTSVNTSKTPPIIDHLDTYPYPVPAEWTQEKFEVRKYDEGMDWEAVFTFDGDVREQALAYKGVIEGLGYETQTLLNDVFKIGEAKLAGVVYHGTFTFSVGDQYSEWGEGQGYVKIVFSEKK